MKARFTLLCLSLVLIAADCSIAQNKILIKECIIEPLAVDEKHPGLQPYFLKLKLVCSLMSENIATLKLALDSEKEGIFQTVAEKRVRKGKGVPLEFEIPIENWKTEKMSIFLVMQGKNAGPDNTPLANTTRIIDKSAVKKEQRP